MELLASCCSSLLWYPLSLAIRLSASLKRQKSLCVDTRTTITRRNWTNSLLICEETNSFAVQVLDIEYWLCCRPYIITLTWVDHIPWQDEKVNRTLNTQVGFPSRLHWPPRHDRIFAYPLPNDQLRIFILKELVSFGHLERTKRKTSSRAVS